MRHDRFPGCHAAAAAAALCLPLAGWAQSTAQPAEQAATNQVKAYASDNDNPTSDHIRLRTPAFGFVAIDGGAAPPAPNCAPVDAQFMIVRLLDKGDSMLVRFLHVPRLPPTGDETKAICKGADQVREGVAYKVPRAVVDTADFRRTGVSFGGLIVPFKFRLGDREIVSSTTVAPYVGYRMGIGASLGLTFTPVLSAGLALVPVANPETGKSDTRSAFSMATGFVVGSSKNEAFQAGVLIGRDFLGRTDRALDPATKKPWLSFYLGYALANN
jgi:hypothetical protein